MLYSAFMETEDRKYCLNIKCSFFCMCWGRGGSDNKAEDNLVCVKKQGKVCLLKKKKKKGPAKGRKKIRRRKLKFSFPPTRVLLLRCSITYEDLSYKRLKSGNRKTFYEIFTGVRKTASLGSVALGKLFNSSKP